MPTTCTRCENTGFLNIDQVEESVRDTGADAILEWIAEHGDGYNDVQVCDCCGDGEEWYGVPGEHYNNEDPPGPSGPYAYNGRLCECH